MTTPNDKAVKVPGDLTAETFDAIVAAVVERLKPMIDAALWSGPPRLGPKPDDWGDQDRLIGKLSDAVAVKSQELTDQLKKGVGE